MRLDSEKVSVPGMEGRIYDEEGVRPTTTARALPPLSRAGAQRPYAPAAPGPLSPAPSPQTVLLVGGDATTRSMLRFLCETDGYAVREAAGVGDEGTGEDAPALYVLLADRRGAHALLTQLAQLRERRAGRVLLLTHGADPVLRRHALAHGASEVVALPIAPCDLQQRLRALIGQQPVSVVPERSVRAGGLTLRLEDRLLGDERGWTVRLTAQEAALLATLMQTPGRLVTRGALAASLWDDAGSYSTNALVALVRRLRARLRHAPMGQDGTGQTDGSGDRGRAGHDYIRTVHGRGYLFEARARPRDRDEPAREAQEGWPRVLVVDDDQATRTMIGEALRQAGYAVTGAAGAQAPALARALAPALILLDINMPGMNGVQVRRELRATPRTAGVPVIALSASTNLRRHSGAMCADDYLPKPFDIDELLLRVERWAGAPAQR